MPARRKFTDAQEREICSRYLAGESTIVLAQAFASSGNAVNRCLRRNGAELRSRNAPRGPKRPEIEPEVCKRYLQGESTVQLAQAFDTNNVLIGNILRRNGIKPRSIREARGGLRSDQEAEVCRRYVAGESTYELGRAFGVSDSTIGGALKRRGIQIRSNTEAHGGLSADRERELCDRYLAGEGFKDLGSAFGVSRCCAYQVVVRHGIKTRNLSEAQGGLDRDGELQACKLYLEGKTARQVAKAFGVGKTTILRILKRHKIERRDGRGGGDSVQEILDKTGRHTHTSDCSFYVFELARYTNTHCKPGISVDIERRVERAEGEYGEEALSLEFSTRAEAWFLEQAVLDATRGSADCPDDLLEWSGASEVRAMPACDLEPIALRLADEMEELGVWEFASLRVPMTAAQRAICQQRAMAGAPACAA